MNPFSYLFILFVIVPVLEIYLLIKVGSVIGAFSTAILVVLTAVIGAWLLRLQGLSTLRRVQLSLSRGEVPAVEMLEGAFLLVGGALLLTPGFFTDTIGFACLIPIVRRGIIQWMIRCGVLVQVVAGRAGPRRTKPGPRTIEGEFWREDDK